MAFSTCYTDDPIGSLKHLGHSGLLGVHRGRRDVIEDATKNMLFDLEVRRMIFTT